MRFLMLFALTVKMYLVYYWGLEFRIWDFQYRGGRRITAIMTPFQGVDAGSTPVARSTKNHPAVAGWFLSTRTFERLLFKWNGWLTVCQLLPILMTEDNKFL